MEERNNFAKGKVSTHILSIAGPMIVAQLINVLYNVIDRIYIGRIPHTATLAMGGLGICLPIISIVIAFATCLVWVVPHFVLLQEEEGDMMRQK